MHHIKLTLQYDGTDFNGWQIQTRQPNSRTVQFTLESALKVLTGEDIRVVAAGRTDTGVHARGQVVSFTTASSIPVERYPRALNGILPWDVVVTASQKVDGNFHARYSARQKTYIYRIMNRPFPDIFWRRHAHHVSAELDFQAMKQAAAYFEGRHDFSSFCASGSNVSGCVREVKSCRVTSDGGLIAVVITADGFLYNMVRIMAGTLLEVGLGKRKPAEVPEIIAQKDRRAAGVTAPACGLTLESVTY